jgi:hypothetical protein
MKALARALTCGMAWFPGRTWAHSRTVGGLVVFAVLAASCGGSGADRSTSTTSPQAAAVLAAYRAEQAAFEQALQQGNPNLPALDQTMSGAQLVSVRRALVTDQVNGIVGHGSVQLYPKVVSIKDGQAIVRDCLFSSLELVYAASGKPVPPVTPPEHDGVQSTLVQATGTWKVSDQKVTDGSCPAGY